MTTTTDPSSVDAGQRPSAWPAELAKLLAEVKPDSNAGAARLAQWRRGLGKQPMQVDHMWADMVRVVELVPESASYREAVEAAVHHALTLYAVHQQSQRDSMHTFSSSPQRRTIGTACRDLRLVYTRENRPVEGLERRFRAAATADTVAEVAWHLRGLIQLLREQKIRLDYVALARDLSYWPDPDGRARVRRRWGLDYHRTQTPA